MINAPRHQLRSKIDLEPAFHTIVECMLEAASIQFARPADR